MNSCPTLGRTRIHARDIISLEYFVLGQNIISGRTKYYCKKLSHRTNYGWDRFSHDKAFLIGKNSGNPKSFYTRQMKLFTDSNCEISPSGYIRVEDFEKMSFERFLKKWDYDLHRESDKNDGNSGNRLRFYAKIKTDFQMEPYLLSTNLSSKSNREQ